MQAGVSRILLLAAFCDDCCAYSSVASIAGGESGPGARPMHIDWARDIRDRCAEQKVKFFFKQWGGLRAKSGGRELDGREWNDFPSRPSALIAAE